MAGGLKFLPSSKLGEKIGNSISKIWRELTCNCHACFDWLNSCFSVFVGTSFRLHSIDTVFWLLSTSARLWTGDHSWSHGKASTSCHRVDVCNRCSVLHISYRFFSSFDPHRLHHNYRTQSDRFPTWLGHLFSYLWYSRVNLRVFCCSDTPHENLPSSSLCWSDW